MLQQYNIPTSSKSLYVTQRIYTFKRNIYDFPFIISQYLKHFSIPWWKITFPFQYENCMRKVVYCCEKTMMENLLEFFGFVVLHRDTICKFICAVQRTYYVPHIHIYIYTVQPRIYYMWQCCGIYNMFILKNWTIPPAI